MTVLCKGSWSLGSACGHCPRCLETAVEGARSLQEQLRARPAMRDIDRKTLELADDVLGTVDKVHGPSALVKLTREKIAAALSTN